MSKGIIKEGELLSRWSFDEGNGSVSNNLSPTSPDAILKDGAIWGTGANAMSKYSLDISTGTGYAKVSSHPNLQARMGFSFMLWFKSNGQVDDYAQILSKKEGTLSPYFVQVDPGGAQIRSMFRFFSNYIDNGAFNFNPYQWHLLVSTYDGVRYISYFDGILTGSALTPLLLTMVS